MGCRPDKHKSSCRNDCLCHILKKYKFSEITIHTKASDIITGKLFMVTKDCCVQIIEPEMMSPFMGKKLTVIRCKDIESFSIDLVAG